VLDALSCSLENKDDVLFRRVFFTFAENSNVYFNYCHLLIKNDIFHKEYNLQISNQLQAFVSIETGSLSVRRNWKMAIRQLCTLNHVTVTYVGT
jgi:hypothetical protein